jgi:clan AA aspartic protease
VGETVITGTVLHRRILIQLVLRGFSDQEAELEFVLDTGFTGVLTLPPSICEALELQYVRPQPANLADGSSVILEVYQAVLVWHSGVYDVEVLAMEGAPLIGMTLLEDSEARFQGREDGLASIGPL